MIYPFDRDGGGVLALFVVTLSLHAAFVSYVVAGTAYALVRPGELAHEIRSRLPFMLGCGITAGVAPLLFVQLLHQRAFYTANLLLGPRWLVVVPALVAGFYGLYLAKSSERWRRVALAGSLACFAFVAWSWSELHELMQADAAWRDFYAAGERLFAGAMIAPRLAVIGGAMASQFALIAAWSCGDEDRRRLARVAVAGRLVSIAGAIWLWRAGFALDDAARGWLYLLVAAALVELAAWLAIALGARANRWLAVATGAGAATLVAAAIVREAPSVAAMQIPANAGGAIAFAIAGVLGAAAIAWVIRTVTATPDRSDS